MPVRLGGRGCLVRLISLDGVRRPDLHDADSGVGSDAMLQYRLLCQSCVVNIANLANEGRPIDLPLKFHPVAIRVSADVTPSGAV
jgi:hypothetical protein